MADQIKKKQELDKKSYMYKKDGVSSVFAQTIPKLQESMGGFRDYEVSVYQSQRNNIPNNPYSDANTTFNSHYSTSEKRILTAKGRNGRHIKPAANGWLNSES